jgi:hypothetical protein
MYQPPFSSLDAAACDLSDRFGPVSQRRPEPVAAPDAQTAPISVQRLTGRVRIQISTSWRRSAPDIASFSTMAHREQRKRLNLSIHRAPESVWNRRGWTGSAQELIVTGWLAGTAGAALVVQGLRRRSKAGRVLVGFGGGLVWWAVSGRRGDLSNARRWFLRVLDPWFGPQDPVQKSSKDSFPASDAPSWTPTFVAGVKPSDRGM